MMDSNRIEIFVYLLLRDHITFGDLEKIMLDIKSVEDKDIIEFTNGQQAQYAMSVTARLLHGWKDLE